MPKLAFKLADRDLLALIPECMGHREATDINRGKSEDLWDQGITIPEPVTPSWAGKAPQQVSYVLLALVALLSAEWMIRKMLRLA